MLPNKSDNQLFRKKITEGLRKATSKMLERAALLDEEVVISRDGKVLKIKAKELIKS